MFKDNNSKIEGKNIYTLFVEITKIILNGYEFKASSNFADLIISGKVKKKK